MFRRHEYPLGAVGFGVRRRGLCLDECKEVTVYVDVHSHLTHKEFAEDLPAVIERAEKAGLTAIIVNGLEPSSNRRVLELAKQYPVIKPALGIYPIEAINDRVSDLPFPIASFDVEQEIAFIESQAKAGTILAIGECGLDGYWVGEETFARQEEVFLKLAEIAVAYDLPLIIHTRKREERSIEILAHHGVKAVNFHCYGGKVKPAVKAAEDHGWYFSIPANARSNEAFRKLLRDLPPDQILTETDCPYLAPSKGARNEPCNVVGTVELLAQIRAWSLEVAQERIWANYERLFASNDSAV
jgi:TatD DNase family protein